MSADFNEQHLRHTALMYAVEFTKDHPNRADDVLAIADEFYGFLKGELDE